MKGLLLKDFYMMLKYCRSYVLMAVVFIAISYADSENMFFVFYPCLLCGMIPASLLSYDERSHWLQYSGTLPYTKAQLVSAKYLIGLMTQLVVLLLTAVVQGLRMAHDGSFTAAGFASMLALILLLSMLASAISLPFMFKLGVEKGRAAYYVMIGVICAGGAMGSALLRETALLTGGMQLVLPLLCVAGAGIYVLSWVWSVKLFERREVV
ncbi:MAG: ABC-2 transporter permease [Clostridiales bacterium]|nr:ABC-2 transporter permease [Clostridiales bacterium]